MRRLILAGLVEDQECIREEDEEEAGGGGGAMSEAGTGREPTVSSGAADVIFANVKSTVNLGNNGFTHNKSNFMDLYHVTMMVVEIIRKSRVHFIVFNVGKIHFADKLEKN